MPPITSQDLDEVATAVTTATAQIKESNTKFTARFDARIGELEQIVAAANGSGFNRNAEAARPVSEVVTAEGDDSLSYLRNGKIKSARFALPSFHVQPQAATLTSGNGYPVPQRDSEVYGQLHRRTNVRDLLVVRKTTSPSIQYLRGTRTGGAAIQATEGDQKAELALNFELKSADVKTIAVWIPASRQALDDVEMLRDYIDIELRDALQLTEDSQLLRGSGIGANISGLWTNAVAFSRAHSNDSPNDTLRRAITQIQLARGTATGIVINPEALERLELLKDFEGRYMSTFTVTDSNGRTSTWRVPVVVTDAMGADEFLVGDFERAARLYDRQEANIEIATQHADFFTRNLLAILAEERVALTVPRPDLLVKGTFAAAPV